MGEPHCTVFIRRNNDCALRAAHSVDNFFSAAYLSPTHASLGIVARLFIAEMVALGMDSV